MKKIFSGLFIFVFLFTARSQGKCELSFTEDTITDPVTGKLITGQAAEVTLREQGSVKLLKADNNKIYLRLQVTENFYFNKTGTLEILSGSKSYYAKDVKQFKLDKTKGRFTIEVFKNYLVTIKEYGITGIVFAGAETKFGKSDAKQIRELASCMLKKLDDKN